MGHYFLSAASKQGVYDLSQLGFAGRHDPRTHPHLIVPFEFKGINFPGGVHRDLRNVAHNLCLDLWPHVKGGFVDGQCGCYVNRNIRGSSSRSMHSYGAAMDFDWLSNPMGESQAQIRREHPHLVHVLPRITTAIALRWGWQWGGCGWSRPDAMHIENHLPRRVAARVRYRRTMHTVEFDLSKHRRAARKRVG